MIPRQNNNIRIMGILNLTPDSFYDGGNYMDNSSVRNRLTAMVNSGADIIDVGAESSRPGSESISLDEEFDRLNLIIPYISSFNDTIFSIDTQKPDIADYALHNGFSIVNDITGGDKLMYQIINNHDSEMVIMHMQGTPETMQLHTHYDDVIEDINQYFETKISIAESVGLSRSSIILDPGIGFGKSIDDNYKIINNLLEFKHFSLPILIGTSRKSFLQFNGDGAENRLTGSIVSMIMSVANGANIVRVHDIEETVKAIEIYTRFEMDRSQIISYE
ncbi:MAG: dihydropteroate synthase [Candidatus Marinimicrobia bacterium]|jgi:dihydropteroate synthase|nr:dihydropteroate synthase [Candidatus Neomarinimicrobiota bacterium]MBT4536654.1 dihydropteroate synthase [Candidatus Neomarinimicrobiota bacterium]MBT6215205.1 dihydropteroate synthase [Candidatus Neomarinimicrobiota bacterium]